MAVIEAIATTYLEADAASVTFSGIPTTYEHLQIRMSGLLGDAGSIGAVYTRFNGDTTAGNYKGHMMRGFATTAQADGSAGGTLWSFLAEGGGTNRASYSGLIMDILDYRNANKNTTTNTLKGHNLGGSTHPNMIDFSSMLWLNTDAITSIAFTTGTSFVRGSSFTLYGLNSS